MSATNVNPINRGGSLNSHRLNDLRRRVAREAAVLLYTEQEKEYKQAKKRAAKNFGTQVLPSNKEVSEELDLLAEETEGTARKERLSQMREDALQLMLLLQDFHPLLIGSVWRGAIHKSSDIDITTFHSEPTEILDRLYRNNIQIERTEWQSVTKKGQKKTSFHIHLNLPTQTKAEIIVRSPEDMNQPVKCEIYGDLVTGLNKKQLQQVLKENPLQKFVP